ncbi:MAG: DUF3656 domain-containing protein [Sumerlaeia bacterium]
MPSSTPETLSLAAQLKAEVDARPALDAADDAPATALVRPEILAPAGDEEMMRAAVENGADAVYFGLQDFNARMRAQNFHRRELPRVVAWLHERGVRAYVTLNTLIFPTELGAARDCLLACSRAGVDAVLVQDTGVAMLARDLVPELPLHASTQMTVTGAEGVAALEAMGLRLDRIVAAREMSRTELRRMRQANAVVEIEVFVHGAICVAYSGQCLTSEALGGRSANRGECAQACRLPYDLVVDGEVSDLGDVRYLLSPKDLSGYSDIADLARMGIVSLKIEGRYKSPQYVAATVAAYRKAVDEAMAGADRPEPDQATAETLAMTFSRGFTGGYLHATDHQAVVEGRFPKKRGLYLGRVAEVRGNDVIVHLEGPLKCGDGVVFDAGKPDEDEAGGFVFGLRVGWKSMKSVEMEDLALHNSVTVVFGHGRVDLRNVKPGDRLWKTSDPKLDSALTASFAGEGPRFRRPVRAFAVARAGHPLSLALWDEDGFHVEVTAEQPLEPARKHPATEAVIREQIERLGGTPFALDRLDCVIEGEPMVPKSLLNDLRRDAAEALAKVRRTRGLDRSDDPSALDRLRAELLPQRETPPPPAESRLSVLCRTLEQVEAAVATGLCDTIYTDFEDIRLHQEARRLIPPRADGGPAFAPAGLRIVKPGESGFVRVLLRSEPDALLVRNLASWDILRRERPDLEIRGDFSLNVANELTAALHRRHGFSWLTPSYDLNLEQLEGLLRAAPPSWFEVTIHQYMPMFHMEHCVFCRFLSDGTDYTNCGRPCEKHTLALRDRVGYEHAVLPDAGCRNTVYNAVAQSGSESLGRLLTAGVRRFRIDLLNETAAQTRQALTAYHPAICGKSSGEGLWKRLNALSKLGVTRGSLDHG